MYYKSPLRYPGGKAKLGPYFARLMAEQPSIIDTYAEPYAGGAGAGLYLLAEGHIDTLLINDLNPGVAAFWRSALKRSDEFVALIENVPVDLASWHRYRSVYLNPDDRDDLELGFATFFLNRCNRSGILTARPIGGLDQTGRWKIDARFNRRNLADRILELAKCSSQIVVTEKPALRFVSDVSRRQKPVLLYVDPPYLVQGEELYMRSHSWDDHERLAKSLLGLKRHPWILTYDTDDRVRNLYPTNRCLRYNISHTAQERRVGSEFMLFSSGLRVSDLSVANNRLAEWIH